MAQPTQGQGYAVSSLAQMGDGPLPPGDGEAVVLVAGGKDGYVGRDGQAVGGNPHDEPPGTP